MAHDELDTVQLVDVVVEVAAGLGPDLLPADGLLLLPPAVAGGVAVEDLVDAFLIDHLLGQAHAVDEVHHVAGHEGDAVLLGGLHHLIAVLVGEGDGPLTEDVLVVPGGTDRA